MNQVWNSSKVPESVPNNSRRDVMWLALMEAWHEHLFNRNTLNPAAQPPATGVNQTLNSSETPEATLNSFRVDGLDMSHLAVCVLIVLICVFGTVGNSLVIWLLGFCMQRTHFYVYILNLAVADLLFLLCMASLISLEIIFLDQYTEVYEIVRRGKYVAYTVGLSLLMAISTQRCLSILFPIWYRCHQPQYLSAMVCASLWTLSLLLNSLAFFFCSYSSNVTVQWCSIVDNVLSILILGVFTPMMTLSSVVLFVRVHRSFQQWHRQPSRLFVVILTSVLVFLVCSLPLDICWFVLSWIDMRPQLKVMLISLSRVFASLGSSVNPLIYYLVGKWRSWSLWEPLGTVFSRALQGEAELEVPRPRGKPSAGTSEVGSEGFPPSFPAGGAQP